VAAGVDKTSELAASAQFNCFTGTKVQILIYMYCRERVVGSGSRQDERACSACRYSFYFLYWYKSTNSDAPLADNQAIEMTRERLAAGLALLVQKYKY
jgi:hypothetical protein